MCYVIKNPFVENSPVAFQSTLSKERLISEYASRFRMDVSEIFASTDSIKLYRCEESGYMFFTPFNITGDSNFYEKLQKFNWYYLPWKWEHQVCSALINAGDRILEIGCGKGDFLRKVSQEYENLQCIGLEINKTSISSGSHLEIINIRVEDYCVDNQGQFDVVCAFQVLEHVPDVNSFLKASIKCLNNNGLLVLSVPNNESFIRYDSFDILNMPPHHMGRWTETSLRMIARNYKLDLVKVEHEPLQEYHFEWYLDIMLNKRYSKQVAGFMMRATRVMGIRWAQLKWLRNRADRIRGHTTIIVLRKTADSIPD